MKEYGGVDVFLHSFVILAVDGDKWLALRPGRFYPGHRAPLPRDALNGSLGGIQSRSRRFITCILILILCKTSVRLISTSLYKLVLYNLSC
jgi:hypothetical protein